MTREEVIRELKQFSGTTRLRLSANFWEALNGAIEALEQEPCKDWYAVTIEKLNEIANIQKWIPVSEKLPKDRENVLFSTKAGIVFEGRFFDDKTNLQWYEYRYKKFEPNNDVTAWMPLPKPYKVESEE